ncbi:hypothetical protein Tco_0243229 [Tanacetum coccineum]
MLERSTGIAGVTKATSVPEARIRRIFFDGHGILSQEVSDNSATTTLDNENTSLSSSIVVEEDEAPQIESSSEEQVATEQTSPVLNENTDEVIQEDDVEFDGNVFYNAPQHS